MLNQEEEDKFSKENPIVFKKYKVKKKLGEGAFGEVYLGQAILENNSYVAMKVEPRNISKPTLESEAYLLYSLAGLGIPKVKSFGKVKNFMVLVEPLLGKSLFDIFAENHKEMPIEDVCLIGKQVIERIQWIHSKFIVHRDIKPDNFLIGKEDPNVIYLIDFGLSKQYRSHTTNQHIKFGFTGKLTGTVRFASANALRGGEQSRRDDIESIGYMLVYFMKKRLPWQGVTGTRKMERYLKIYKMKKNTTPEELCKGLPPEMVDYMTYAKKLEFEQEPNYQYLKNLFKRMLKRFHNTNDQLVFSWIKLKDLPKLKNPVNPASRKDSPQSRLYRQIKKSLEKERNNTSDSNDSKHSYQPTYNQIKAPSNLKLINNQNFPDSEMEPKSSKKLNKKLKIKEGLNTMIANLDVTVDENVVDFDNETLLRGSKDVGEFSGKKPPAIVPITNIINSIKDSNKKQEKNNESVQRKIIEDIKENEINNEINNDINNNINNNINNDINNDINNININDDINDLENNKPSNILPSEKNNEQVINKINNRNELVFDSLNNMKFQNHIKPNNNEIIKINKVDENQLMEKKSNDLIQDSIKINNDGKNNELKISNLDGKEFTFSEPLGYKSKFKMDKHMNDIQIENTNIPNNKHKKDYFSGNNKINNNIVNTDFNPEMNNNKKKQNNIIINDNANIIKNENQQIKPNITDININQNKKAGNNNINNINNIKKIIKKKKKISKKNPQNKLPSNKNNLGMNSNDKNMEGRMINNKNFPSDNIDLNALRLNNFENRIRSNENQINSIPLNNFDYNAFSVQNKLVNTNLQGFGIPNVNINNFSKYNNLTYGNDKKIEYGINNNTNIHSRAINPNMKPKLKIKNIKNNPGNVIPNNKNNLNNNITNININIKNNYIQNNEENNNNNNNIANNNLDIRKINNRILIKNKTTNQLMGNQANNILNNPNYKIPGHISPKNLKLPQNYFPKNINPNNPGIINYPSNKGNNNLNIVINNPNNGKQITKNNNDFNITKVQPIQYPTNPNLIPPFMNMNMNMVNNTNPPQYVRNIRKVKKVPSKINYIKKDNLNYGINMGIPSPVQGNNLGYIAPNVINRYNYTERNNLGNLNNW